MRDEIDEMVDVAFDSKIDTPSSIDPGLPDVSTFVVLLGSERRVAKILEEECDTTVNGLLDPGRSACIAFKKALGVKRPHLPFLELLCLPVERADHVFCGRERPIDPAFLDVLKTLAQTPFNELAVDDDLGDQGDPLALDLRFQEITHDDARLLAHRGRKRDLILLLDLYEGHGGFSYRAWCYRKVRRSTLL
jgi:hypothetical protein